MDKVEQNIEKLRTKTQVAYMHEVKNCILRVSDRCGHSSSCRSCPHYKMVKQMTEEYKKLDSTEEPIDFYTISGSKEHISSYIDAFEVDLVQPYK